ncbi:DNA-3-methyladenine glycosylase [Candidatus Aerophobetes bacterium]|nr:DNA-3-methyladenine glycosylase [Candidatus Aerophobetes bacterium]
MAQKLKLIPLPRSFYAKDTELVAKKLLGKLLVRILPEGRLVGRIVETEAYYGVGDPASHSFRGKTKRSSVMWEKPGTAYVYFTYGMHFLLNVVTEKENVPGAVLIRAVEPMEGIEIMRKNRKKENLRELARGPARLTQAFAIDGSFNRYDLTQENALLFIAEGKEENFEIESTARKGIKKGLDKKLRFFIRENPFVS